MNNALDILSGRPNRPNKSPHSSLPKHYKRVLGKNLGYNFNADLDGEIAKFLTNKAKVRIRGVRYRITPKEQSILRRILKLHSDAKIARKTTKRNLEKLLVSVSPSKYSRYIKRRVSHILSLKGGAHKKESISRSNKKYLLSNGSLRGVNNLTLKSLIDKNLSYIKRAIGGNTREFSVTDRHGNTNNVFLGKSRNGKLDYYYKDGPQKGKRVRIFDGYKLAPKDSLLYGTPDSTSHYEKKRSNENEKYSVSNALSILRKKFRRFDHGRTLRNIESLSNRYNFKNKVAKFFIEAWNHGHKLKIIEGYRTEAQQRHKVKMGRSTTMRSAHRKGLAIDVYEKKRYRYTSNTSMYLRRLAAKYGLWNGTEMWDKDMPDPGHFQAYYQGARSKKRRRIARMRKRGTLPRYG